MSDKDGSWFLRRWLGDEEVLLLVEPETTSDDFRTCFREVFPEALVGPIPDVVIGFPTAREWEDMKRR